MPNYNYKKVDVKGHYRTYTVGSYPGPYKTIKKWIKPHKRTIPKVTMITQATSVKEGVPFFPQTMVKEIPQNLIDGIKTLVKDQEHEYSINIDFERHLEAPEQMLIMKGGKTETVKIDDFELFGHTHPGHTSPIPSRADIENLHPLKPEFIVAQKTGKTIIMNIEDLKQWKKYRNREQSTNVNLRMADSKYGRDLIFRRTGVRIYPLTQPLKIEIIDDPHPEKKFPRVGSHYMEKWSK